ncbi:MAG: DUF1553 domain-containing protein [Planctomycetota bacterium]
MLIFPTLPRPGWIACTALFLSVGLIASDAPQNQALDFNRDIKPILSNTCYKCHGPDAAERKGGTKAHPLRLDTDEGAYAENGGTRAIAPGHPEKSELIARIVSKDDEQIMPPAKSGKPLSGKEVDILKRWISQGAKYSKHWSYVKPERPTLPDVKDKGWARNAIDAFLLARLDKEGLKPQPEADRHMLVRRVTLDVTGLPPTVEEVEQFVNDKSPDAYEKLVDRMLSKPAYGEHWSRMWLDLARYADSGGYASDTPRTIWAYRDYVIKSYNENKPFDKFTLEQIAGDLLPNPTQEQLIASAFHRNTMTNTEGGTTREEFRNAAVVDRVNTTMAVWMGISINCAQCHDHKYDPLPQKDFFRLFAIHNNTEDADRPDEEPTLKFYSPQQNEQRSKLEADIAGIEAKFKTPTAAQVTAQVAWEKKFPLDLKWTTLDAPVVKIDTAGGKQIDTLTFAIPATAKKMGAIRVDAIPGEIPKGKAETSVIATRVRATLIPSAASSPEGRFVRVELPGKAEHLMLAEVQVFSGGENVALKGVASQSSTDFGGEAKRANDGKTDGHYFNGNSVSHTAANDNPWWEVDLKSAQKIENVVVWNRTDGGAATKLKGAQVVVLDEKRKEVWRSEIKQVPSPSITLETGGARTIQFAAAHADSEHNGYDADAVVREAAPAPAPKKGAKKAPKMDKPGWSINLADGKAHTLTLVPTALVDVPIGSKLELSIAQSGLHPLGGKSRFAVSTTDDTRADELSRTPPDVVQTLTILADKRSAEQRDTVTQYYLEHITPDLKADRDRLVALKKQIDDMKPVSVPVMRELAEGKRRITKVQLRGNYLSLGDDVKEGTPGVLHPLPANSKPDRLGLAKWLMDEANPLTPRVIANRYWEQIFGVGIVRTSEEFGSQGEPPSHPELLDWLATELIQQKWDMKQFVKLLLTSAAYRQSSKVSAELTERDPDNRLLARGPRFRMSAEMIRDQALAVSGLLSPKMYGPSVKPPRPSAGLSAAFGGGLDWATSMGEDKFRRGLYTEARRTSPYPSTATFDAPSREICTLRRVRTNTPLQALVTLNDPVYVEAAQALARRMNAAGQTPQDKLRAGFNLCLARPPQDAEIARLLKLFDEAKADFAKDAKSANEMATNPIGALPKDADVTELAAWTTVANVLLNLDELMMKR